MKKILMVSDCVISREMYMKYFDFAWSENKVVIVEDMKGFTDIDFQKWMLDTEQKGPEAFKANEEVLKQVSDTEILVVHMSIINKKILDAAKNLKIIFVCRGGCDNINMQYAAEKGIKVINAASRSADAVADVTVAMMISEMKNLIRSAIAMHDGKWIKEFTNFGHHHNLKTQTVGIIGFGEIGQRVAERLKGFGCRILAYDPFISDENIVHRGGNPVSFDNLLKESDIVSIHLRLSEKTRHFIGEKEFTKMKKTAYFINNARSGLVDQKAMINALKTRKIMGAALDVFDVEPLPLDHPLRELDNVSLTPHMAGVSCDTVNNGVELMAEELQKYLKGKQ